MTAAPTAGDALALVRLAASGAAGALARHASRIDDINVFPVPDGDTGANLSQTARSVLDALQASSQPEPSAIARVGARAALLGARGNSGIILSQLVRGACDRLGEGGRLDGPAIADALRRASTEADAALREPVEGTILTVARALADGAEAARSQDPIATLAAGLAAAEVALARTPDMLPVLRAAGVVDAGGAGLVELVRGALAALRGEPIADAAPLWEHRTRRSAPTTPGRATAPASWSPARSRASSSNGSSRRSATASWWSPTASSCAPTCTPTTPAPRSPPRRRWERSPASRSATCTRSATRSPSAPRPPLALEDDGRLADVLAIVDGDGNRVLYASLGARLLLSGRPTVDELLDAMRTSPAGGHRPAPERSGAARRRPVRRAGGPRLGARRALARPCPGPRRARRLPHRPAGRGARGGVRGGGRLGRERRGPGGAGDDAAALREAVAPALAPGSTLVTVLAGAAAEQSALDALATWLAQAHPGVELELHAGGQAHPRYSVSAE